jgi:acetylornithine/N-succinyldiaminopimelate aminotransferase
MAQRLRKRSTTIVRQDRRLVGRSEDLRRIQIVSADGNRVVDARGRTFIDFQMGWCVGNLGWNNSEITERIRAFSGPSYVQPSELYAPWVELAGRLAEVTPGALSRSYRAVGGSEAVDMALQLAQAYTKRRNFVSIEGAYHGNSIAARSIGEGDLENPLSGCKKLELPLDGHAVDRLETLLEDRDVAAFILEPVAMNLGVEVPDPEFMWGAARMCELYGTLLIADEVACGFGRTGKLFASEHYELTPDILCLGKAITSGHAPLAAMMTTGEIADAVDFDPWSTFGWHPLAVEAALATLDYFDRHGAHLLANVEERASDFRRRLSAMAWTGDAEIRIKGLAIAVRLDAQRVTAIASRCRDYGLLVGAEEDYLTMFPALTIDEATAHAGLDVLEAAVA